MDKWTVLIRKVVSDQLCIEILEINAPVVGQMDILITKVVHKLIHQLYILFQEINVNFYENKMSLLWIEESIKIGQKTKEFKYYTLQEHQRTRSNAEEYKDSDMFQKFLESVL